MVKFVGADVHSASINFCVENEKGGVLSESVVATQRESVLGFIGGLKGEVHLAFEEGTQAHWLYWLLKNEVSQVIVCDPRKTKGNLENKSDKIDARKLCDFLRAGLLTSVFHGGREEISLLKESIRTYNYLTGDSSRIKNRIKAVYRSRGISCSGDKIYNKKHRETWIDYLNHEGLRYRVSTLFRELDGISKLRSSAEKKVLQNLKKHEERKVLMSVPGIGPLRAAELIATVVDPRRFRNKRAFWTYCGFAVVKVSSGDYTQKNGGLVRNAKKVSTRGLNRNRCPRLKALFKEGAINAMSTEEFRQYSERLVDRGLSKEIARVNVARKLSSIVLTTWKKGELYDSEKMKMQK